MPHYIESKKEVIINTSYFYLAILKGWLTSMNDSYEKHGQWPMPTANVVDRVVDGGVPEFLIWV